MNAAALPALFAIAPAVTEGMALTVAKAHTLAEITDSESAEAAVAVNGEVSRWIKLIGEQRLEQTRQLDAIKARAMDYERNITRELVEIRAAIDSALNAYRSAIAAEKARREAAAKAAEAEIAGGEAEGERMTAPLVVVEPILDEAKIPTRKVARVLIVDRSAIPAHFFVLDEKAVMAALKKGETVPGAALTYEEVLVRR